MKKKTKSNLHFTGLLSGEWLCLDFDPGNTLEVVLFTLATISLRI